MMQLGTFDQRDDTPTTFHPGYSLDADGRDAPMQGNASAGSFRSLVKSANASLRKSCTTLGSQSSVILDCVGGKMSTLRSTTSSMNRNKDDQGIFSNESTAPWGSVGESVSTFTASKVAQVAPIFNSGSLMNAASGLRKAPEEISFNYQLMSDE